MYNHVTLIKVRSNDNNEASPSRDMLGGTLPVNEKKALLNKYILSLDLKDKLWESVISAGGLFHSDGAAIKKTLHRRLFAEKQRGVRREDGQKSFKITAISLMLSGGRQ